MTPPDSSSLPSDQKQFVLCFDMDGTILDEHEHFYPQDIPFLRTPPAHVLFMLATGRSLPSVLLTWVKNGLIQAGERLPFPVVCQNGSVTYLPGGVPHHCQQFEPGVVEEVIRRVDPYPQLTILLFLYEDILGYRVTPHGQERLDMYDLAARPAPEGAASLPVTKIMCISPQPDMLEDLYESTACLPLERTYSFNTILEFGPPGVNKAIGITSLLDAMRLSHLPLYVAGDGMNDLTMLKAATRAFVPDTGSEYALALAHVILPVRQQGLLAPMLADWQQNHPG